MKKSTNTDASTAIDTGSYRGIRHHLAGEPADVLAFETIGAIPEPGPEEVRVRVACVPIHPGDLHMIRGSAKGGNAPTIPPEGRVPGFEGAGTIEALGDRVDPALGLKVGDRVAFFPAQGCWSEQVTLAAEAVVKLPETMSFSLAAQMLINTITAQVVLRAAGAAFPAAQEPRLFILTAAGSAVGRLITTLAHERGMQPLRLVRSRRGAEALQKKLGGSPIFATDDPEWKAQLAKVINGHVVHVAIDAVAGSLLKEIASFVANGGAIINYASLSTELSDVQWIAPHELTLRGVSIGVWGRLPAKIRANDQATALRLAKLHREQFDIAGIYAPHEIADAVRAVEKPGKEGTVMLVFDRSQSSDLRSLNL